MARNAFRRDAQPQAKVLRFIKPVNLQGVRPVFSINNKSLEWDDWDAGVMAQDINALSWPELEEITASDSSDDLVLTGPEDEDFHAEIDITPTITVELVQGAEPLNQISRISFSSATGGTYVLTVNGDSTAAINVGDVADCRSKLDTLSSGDFTVTEVENGDILVEFISGLAEQAVEMTVDATNSTQSVGSLVIEQIHDDIPERCEVIVVGVPSSKTISLHYLGQTDYLNSAMTAADLKERLETMSTDEVDVYGGQIDPGDGDDAALWVIKFKDRPGEANILGAASPNNFQVFSDAKADHLYNATTGVISSAGSAVGDRELVVFDTIAGSITLEYGGRELKIDQGITAAALQTLLDDHVEFAEWVCFSDPYFSTPPSAGEEHPNLVFAYWDRQLRHSGGSGISRELPIDESHIRQTGGNGSFVVLNKGGTGADGAAYRMYRQGNVNGGTFDLELSEGSVSSQAWDVSASSLQTAAQLVRAAVTVEQGQGTAGDPWIWNNGTGGDSDQVPRATDAFTAPGAMAVSIDREFIEGTDAVQTVIVSPRASTGDYLLRYGAEGPLVFTPGMSAAAFKTKLEGFPSLGTAGDTAVAYDSASGRYTIDFQGNLSESIVDAIVLVSSALATAADESNSIVDQRPTGPRDFSNPDNWTLGRAPEQGDDVVIDDVTSGITYGMAQRVKVTGVVATDILQADGWIDFRNGQKVRAITQVPGATLPTGLATATDYYVVGVDQTRDQFQLSATKNGTPIDLTSPGSGDGEICILADNIFITANATGSIGREESAGEYREYRNRYVKLGLSDSGKLDIGDGAGLGSPLLRVDIGATDGKARVQLSGSSIESGYPAVNLLADGGAAVTVMGGHVGIAAGEIEESSVASLVVNGGDVVLGKVDCSGNLDQDGGGWSARELTVGGVIRSNG